MRSLGAALLAVGQLLGGAAAAGAPAEPGRLFVAANADYEAGRYGAAAAAYQELLDRGLDDGRLHYNLGNARLRNGELGRAVASYLRGLRRMPRDSDLRANLAFARRSSRDALAPPAPSPVVSALFFWHERLGPAELEGLLLALNLLFWGLATARLFRRDSEILRWVLVLLLVLLLGTAGSLVVHRAFPTRVAVILPPEIEARTAPEPGALVRFRLHAGTEVRLRGRQEGWLRIELPDGQQAWIEEGWAEVVGG